MTDPEYAHYVGIFDRSGSMDCIQAETENGIRQFFAEQKELPGRATASIYQFDYEPQLVTSMTSLEELPDYALLPRGSTALLDAIGYAIEHEGRKLAALPEDKRPGRVYVIIATDGEENSSRNFGRADIKAKIKHQSEVYGWEFVYMGANVDAFAEADSIGIAAAASLDYDANDVSVRTAYKMSAGAVRRSRASGQSVSYTDAERRAVKDE